MMKRFVIALVVLLASAVTAAAAERIERFISDVDVQRNGDLLVTETIQVWAQGEQIKRGILRDFPTVYHRPDGSRVEVGFNVRSVTRDGHDEPYSTERMDNGVRIRIGSAEQFLSTGSHQYVIKYKTTRQIGFFDKFDELYWNATGTGWTFPIDVAEARINLPEAVEFERTAIYTGYQGARDHDATIVERRPGHIVFRTTQQLPAENGLTVAAAWPKGVVAPPVLAQRFVAMLQDDQAFLRATIGGAGVVLFYLSVWWFVGRDPRRGTVIPLFGPPDRLSAAAVRFFHRMGYDSPVFTVAIIGLGAHGHLKLIEKDDDQVLQHLRSSTPLDPAEQSVEKALFDSGRRSSLPLKPKQHRTINKAKSELELVLRLNYEDKLFTTNSGWSSIGFLGVLVLTIAIGHAHYASYVAGETSGAMLAAMLIPILPIVLGVALISSMIADDMRDRTNLGAGCIVTGVLIGLVALSTTDGRDPAIVSAMVPWGLAALGMFGFTWLKAPSPEGRRVMDQIDGFKRYLGVAEEEHLKNLGPPPTKELFERFLPYAIALGVQNAWAQRFAEVLAKAGVEPAGTISVSVGSQQYAGSSWYQTDRLVTQDFVSFTDRMNEELSRTIASASSPPGSSDRTASFFSSDSSSSSSSSSWSSSSSDSSNGSSGGGSSGGGGGGGGGSGW